MSHSSKQAQSQSSGSTRRSTRRLSDKGGSVIVAVLAFVVLFSFIVLAFQKEAISKIRYSGLFQHRDDLRSQAFSTMEATLAVVNALRDIDGGLYHPVDGWGNPSKYIDLPEVDGIRTTVRVIDESSRLPLRGVERDTLTRVFQLMDFDMLLRQSLTDTLLDWMDENQEDNQSRIRGFSNNDYLRLRPPYRARSGPLRTWDELELVHGWRDAFWDEDGLPKPELNRFRSLFSLDNEGPVNVNTATSDVLAVLQELGVVDAYAIQHFRSGIQGLGRSGIGSERPIRSRDAQFFPGDSQLAGVEASLLRIEVEASRGEARFLLTSLVRWRGSDVGGGQGRAGERTRAPRERPARDGTSRAAQTSQGDSAKLGYPFEIVRLTENRKM